jgi:hypothetical protein
MSSLRRLPVSSSLAFIVLLAAPGAAWAEEPPVVKALLDGIALSYQSRPTYKSIDTGGDGTITIKGLVFNFPQDLGVQYEVESITFGGVSEAGEGRFEVANATYSGMTFKFNGQMVAAIPTITSSQLFVRAAPDNPTAYDKVLASSTIARELTIPEVVILIAEKSLTVENIHMTFEGDPWAYSGTQRATVGRFVVPQDIIALAGDDLPLGQLGYTSIELSSESTFQFHFTPEAMSFGFDMGLTAKDMGTLHMAGTFTDIPFALIEAAEKADSNDDQILQLTSNIAVSGLKVGFTDGSLTNRLIDFFAASQNMDRAQIIATAAASVQLGLTELKNQDFTNRVIAAVNSFLASPASIHVQAAMAPVKVEQFIQAGEDPAALMNLLQVEVKANE